MLIVYLPSCLGQETAKGTFAVFETSYNLLLPV